MIEIIKVKEVKDRAILSSPKPTDDVSDKVAAILAEVKERGDAALYEYTEKFDKVKLSSLTVTEDECVDGLVGCADKRTIIFELPLGTVCHRHTNTACSVTLLAGRIVAHRPAAEVEKFWCPETAIGPLRPLVENIAHLFPCL